MSGISENTGGRQACISRPEVPKRPNRDRIIGGEALWKSTPRMMPTRAKPGIPPQPRIPQPGSQPMWRHTPLFPVGEREGVPWTSAHHHLPIPRSPPADRPGTTTTKQHTTPPPTHSPDPEPPLLRKRHPSLASHHTTNPAAQCRDRQTPRAPQPTKPGLSQT